MLQWAAFSLDHFSQWQSLICQTLLSVCKNKRYHKQIFFKLPINNHRLPCIPAAPRLRPSADTQPHLPRQTHSGPLSGRFAGQMPLQVLTATSPQHRAQLGLSHVWEALRERNERNKFTDGGQPLLLEGASVRWPGDISQCDFVSL